MQPDMAGSWVSLVATRSFLYPRSGNKRSCMEDLLQAHSGVECLIGKC